MPHIVLQRQNRKSSLGTVPLFEFGYLDKTLKALCGVSVWKHLTLVLASEQLASDQVILGIFLRHAVSSAHTDKVF